MKIKVDQGDEVKSEQGKRIRNLKIKTSWVKDIGGACKK